jgi:hypothetical protein
MSLVFKTTLAQKWTHAQDFSTLKGALTYSTGVNEEVRLVSFRTTLLVPSRLHFYLFWRNPGLSLIIQC